MDRSLPVSRRACRRAVAAGPVVLLVLLTAAHLAAAPAAADLQVSLGFVEEHSNAERDVAFRVRSADGTTLSCRLTSRLSIARTGPCPRRQTRKSGPLLSGAPPSFRRDVSCTIQPMNGLPHGRKR